VGTKVLDLLRACVKVANCCDPSSAGILTCIKSLVTCVESILSPCPSNSQEWIIVFVLVGTIRVSLH
jgi:hypothetical protein